MLFATQVISGIGIAIGASVGALLAADIAGVGLSGAALSANVVGAALFALPATILVHRHGRRASLAAGYLVAALGSLLIVASALQGSVAILFLGFFLFGGATAAGLQARYAAVDLAPPALRGRHLSLIVWATTLGAVVGPSLAVVASAALDQWGVPAMAGPYVFSALLLGVSSLILVVLLRPDPAVMARAATVAAGEPTFPAGERGLGAAWRAVTAGASARLGVSAMATGHLVMVGVMTMTPVHIRGAGHDATQTLRLVGIVLSLHIAGMFAFSPVVGWLTDRLGRRAVILAGIAILLAACATAAAAGHEPIRLVTALTLLGLGWSATMVAGSTLLTESVPTELRASAQGLSDLLMGLAGASAGAASGVVVDWWGYPRLTLLAALGTIPLIVLLASSLARGGRPAAALPQSGAGVGSRN